MENFESSNVDHLSSEIELNKDFLSTFDLLEKTMNNVFITGKAGTGKSTLLKYFKSNSKKNIILLAPTGVAALNIGGMTIHKFFNFPPRPINIEEIHESGEEIYKVIDTIVIDEISMVRADLLDGIDQFLRVNGEKPTLPFGGVQMVFFGDLYQLSPIVSNEEEAKYISSRYDSPWFFSALSLNQLDLKYIELKKVYRQKDASFIEILDHVRKNEVTHKELEILNSRYFHLFSTLKDEIITLTCTKKRARRINFEKLSKLQTEEFVYLGKIEGEFPLKMLPADFELQLKVGAQVMFVKNDLHRRWVNGTIGKVSNLGEDSIEVEITSEEQSYFFNVDRDMWEIPKYKYDPLSRRIDTEKIGKFTQFPLILAWAVTIHKSQGLTFDDLKIDLERGAFAYGQVYVAVSRAKSLEGIYLQRPINFYDIKMDIQVSQFLDKINFLKISQIEELLNTRDNKEVSAGERPKNVSPPSIGEKVLAGTVEVPNQNISNDSKPFDGKSTQLWGTYQKPSSTIKEEQHLQRNLDHSTQYSKIRARYSNEIRGFKVIGVAIAIFILVFWIQSFWSVINSNEPKNPTSQSPGIVIFTPSQVGIFHSQTPVISTPIEKATPNNTKPKKDPMEACLFSVSSLSIRECPGTNYTVIGYLLNGECVEIIGKDETNTWIALEGGGWVNAYYLEINDDLKMLPIVGCLLD